MKHHEFIIENNDDDIIKIINKKFNYNSVKHNSKYITCYSESFNNQFVNCKHIETNNNNNYEIIFKYNKENKFLLIKSITIKNLKFVPKSDSYYGISILSFLKVSDNILSFTLDKSILSPVDTVQIRIEYKICDNICNELSTISKSENIIDDRGLW